MTRILIFVGMAIGVALVVLALVPEEEPTVQDKLEQARENLSEAAELAKEAAEEKADALASEIENKADEAAQSVGATLEGLQKQAEDFAAGVTTSMGDRSEELADFTLQFEQALAQGGALHHTGFDPANASKTLEQMGLDRSEADRLSAWLADVYATPGNIEETLDELLEKLKDL
ncbi:hypothetical protein QEZ52_21945 (plasmid) [Aliisedimentitalea scapharcae]|uniref:Uncharacterized protein n=1 Tax=Aliisedimentitalea scapharcae TaxID=1524259 RepID=A0ABZ2XZ76_9RHOB